MLFIDGSKYYHLVEEYKDGTCVFHSYSHLDQAFAALIRMKAEGKNMLSIVLKSVETRVIEKPRQHED